MPDSNIKLITIITCCECPLFARCQRAEKCGPIPPGCILPSAPKADRPTSAQPELPREELNA